MPNSRPSPDYIGPRYRGLVVVGANPGIAITPSQKLNDARTFELQERIATGDRDAFAELLRHLPDSMLGWKQMVNRSARAYLDYDVEEIAYINLVKCATTITNSDVRKLFKGAAKDVPSRCWNLHTRAILEALNPHFVVALWIPVLQNLEWLGYRFDAVKKFAAYNGQRNLRSEEKYKGVKAVFDFFNEWKKPEPDS